MWLVPYILRIQNMYRAKILHAAPTWNKNGKIILLKKNGNANELGPKVKQVSARCPAFRTCPQNVRQLWETPIAVWYRGPLADAWWTRGQLLDTFEPVWSEKKAKQARLMIFVRNVCSYCIEKLIWNICQIFSIFSIINILSLGDLKYWKLG